MVRVRVRVRRQRHQGRPPLLLPQQIQAILDGCAVFDPSTGEWAGNLWDRLLFALLAETGMRLGEARQGSPQPRGSSVGGGSKLRAAFSAVCTDVVSSKVGRVLCVGAGGDLGCDPALFEPPNNRHRRYHHHGQDDAAHDVLGLTVDRVADRNSGTSHYTSPRAATSPKRMPEQANRTRIAPAAGVPPTRRCAAVTAVQGTALRVAAGRRRSAPPGRSCRWCMV